MSTPTVDPLLVNVHEALHVAMPALMKTVGELWAKGEPRERILEHVWLKAQTAAPSRRSWILTVVGTELDYLAACRVGDLIAARGAPPMTTDMN